MDPAQLDIAAGPIARGECADAVPTPMAGAHEMRAIVARHHGGPEVLTLAVLPRPTPGPGEVLVAVHAAGVNPVDWKTREGRGVASGLDWSRPHGPDARPVILGWDLAGVVADVGAGVTSFVPGDAVFGMPRFPAMASAYAEYAVVPAHELARIPASLDAVHAAALPLAGLTAYQALIEVAEVAAGQTVLVHAAAGGVGHLAVQLAKWRGARVIGTASARHHAFLHALGADEVIDYTAERFEDAVLARVGQVDVVLDGVGGETLTRSMSVIRPGGALVSIVDTPDDGDAVKRQVGARWILVRPDGQHLAVLARLVEDEQLRPTVETVLPLERAATAHSLSATGRTRGKIVLTVGASAPTPSHVRRSDA